MKGLLALERANMKTRKMNAVQIRELQDDIACVRCVLA